VGVEIWENIGMEIKDRNGRYIMCDDPKFGPIYKDIAGTARHFRRTRLSPTWHGARRNPSNPSWS